MNVKHFSVAPSTLGTLATAIRMRRIGRKYINIEQFEKLCLQIGEEFISDLSSDEKYAKILEAADKYADNAAEPADVII